MIYISIMCQDQVRTFQTCRYYTVLFKRKPAQWMVIDFLGLSGISN
jgi:hypothetical protein